MVIRLNSLVLCWTNRNHIAYRELHTISKRWQHPWLYHKRQRYSGSWAVWIVLHNIKLTSCWWGKRIPFTASLIQSTNKLKNPLIFSKMIGFEWIFNWDHVIISIFSSIVPYPPGNTIKASPSSDILFFRLCMSGTTTVSQTCSPLFSSIGSGTTPITFPPFSSISFAKIPIMPTDPPPKIQTSSRFFVIVGDYHKLIVCFVQQKLLQVLNTR